MHRKYNYDNISPSYDQIMLMLDRGIVGKVKTNTGPFEFAFRGGSYLGSPGKDIYFSFPNLSKKQFKEVAKKAASLYPSSPPKNHVKWAAFIRYVYGCFEKQGCLRSKKDKRIIINENPDWNISQQFMERMLINFNDNKCYYGKVLFHEMYGHRLGDRAIIDNNYIKLDDMLYQYTRSQEIAEQIKSYKHIFTPFYWAAHYFYEMNDKERCIKYHKKCLQKMNKYCPDARPGYREKALTSLIHLKKFMKKKEWNKYKKIYSTYTNKCLKKVKIP